MSFLQFTQNVEYPYEVDDVIDKQWIVQSDALWKTDCFKFNYQQCFAKVCIVSILNEDCSWQYLSTSVTSCPVLLYHMSMQADTGICQISLVFYSPLFRWFFRLTTCCALSPYLTTSHLALATIAVHCLSGVSLKSGMVRLTLAPTANKDPLYRPRRPVITDLMVHVALKTVCLSFYSVLLFACLSVPENSVVSS